MVQMKSPTSGTRGGAFSGRGLDGGLTLSTSSPRSIEKVQKKKTRSLLRAFGRRRRRGCVDPLGCSINSRLGEGTGVAPNTALEVKSGMWVPISA